MPAILRFNTNDSGPTVFPSSFFMLGTHNSGVPNSGVRILRSGQGVFYSQAGALLPRDMSLRSLSFSAQNSNGNTYRLDFLGDPAQKLGPRFVISSMTIPPNTDSFSLDGLDVPVSQQEVGLQLVRILGAGALGGDVWTMAELEG